MGLVGKPLSSKSGFGGLLKLADLYGKTPSLLYRGSKSLKSKFGGSISIIGIMCKLLCIALVVRRYLDRSSPETNVNTFYVENPEGFHLTKNNLPFAFGLQKSTGEHFIDERVYIPQVRYLKYFKRTQNGKVSVNKTEVDLPLIPCNLANLDAKYFTNLDLSKMYCLKEFVEKRTDIKITGVWESDVFGFVDIKIQRCSGDGCRSEAEIESYLRSSYFAINYVNFAILSSNFSNPVEMYPTSYYTTTSTTYSKNVQMRLTDNEVVTHSSLFGYVNPSIRKFSQTHQFITDISGVKEEGKTLPILLEMLIRMNQQKIVTNRAYKNVFHYLAELGGLLQVISLTAVILTFRFSSFSLLLDLARIYYRKQLLVEKVLRSSPSLPIEQKEKNLESVTSRRETPQPKPSKIISGFERIRTPTPNQINIKVIEMKRAKKPALARKKSIGLRAPSTNQIPSRPASTDPMPEILSMEPVYFNPETKRGQSPIEELHESADLSPADLPKNKTDPMSQSKPQAKEERLLDEPIIGSLLKRNPMDFPKLKVSAFVPKILEKENFEEDLGAIQSTWDPLTSKNSLAADLIDKSVKLNLHSLSKDTEDSNNCSSETEGLDLFLESFLPFFLPKNSKIKKILKTSENKVLCQMDYLNLLDALQDIQKIKAVLFTPDQRVLFEFLPASNPEVSLKKQFLEMAAHRQPTQLEIGSIRQEMVSALKRIRDKRCLDRIDSELMLRLGYLIKEDSPVFH